MPGEPGFPVHPERSEKAAYGGAEWNGWTAAQPTATGKAEHRRTDEGTGTRVGSVPRPFTPFPPFFQVS